LPHTVYLSLGSNVGDRAAQLQEATCLLSAVGVVTTVSSLYETEPVEFADQPWFLNCAATLETEAEPGPLLAQVLQIEKALGRERAGTPAKGPRRIDIDILLFDDLAVDSPPLTIPHPAMHQRRFVLEPLAEIAPDVQHPVLHKTIRELLRALPPGQTVRPILRARE
jgi:2-amino-4-hydroxy-6-hydroxymethyldihydropteridine diphosphokinase